VRVTVLSPARACASGERGCCRSERSNAYEYGKPADAPFLRTLSLTEGASVLDGAMIRLVDYGTDADGWDLLLIDREVTLGGGQRSSRASRSQWSSAALEATGATHGPNGR